MKRAGQDNKKHPLRDLANGMREEAEARRFERESRREHNQFMRVADEERVRRELRRDNDRDAENLVDSMARAVGDTLETMARIEEDRRREERRRAKISSLTEQFDAQKQSLVITIEQLKREGQSFADSRKYNDAELKYNQCLSIIGQLNTAWVNFQREIDPRQVVYTYQYADMLRGEIVALSNTATLNQARDLTSEAESCSAKQHVVATQKLQEAKQLLNKINAGHDRYFLQVEGKVQTNAKRMAWEANKSAINAASKSILQVCDSSTDLENIVSSLSAQCAKYTPYKDFLVENELQLLRDLNSKLSIADQALRTQREHVRRQARRVENQNLQTEAYKKIDKARESLRVGNIPLALNALREGRALVSRITDFNDITSQNHTQPELFEENISKLKGHEKSYNNNASIIPQQTALIWINNALERRRDDKNSQREELYYVHQQEIQLVISNALAEQWHKFDRRPIPEDFGKFIVDLIFQRLKREQIGWKKWFWHWEATVSLRHTDSDPMHITLNTIKLAIDEYKPQQEPEYIELTFPLNSASRPAPFAPGYNSNAGPIPVAVVVGSEEDEEQRLKQAPSAPPMESGSMFGYKFW